MEQKAVLSCEHVSFCYPRQTDNAIEDISFSIGEAEFVVLCGQSGCGKTTLLRHFKKNQIPFGTGSGKLFTGGVTWRRWMTGERGTDRLCRTESGYTACDR